MNKIIFTLIIVFLSLFIINEFADCYIPHPNLPRNANLFIELTYGDIQIWSVERDGSKYKVKLSNVVSIDFDREGNWINIDSKYEKIPESVLPEKILNSLKNQHPNAIIIGIEKELGNYKIKLNNMIEVYISNSGQLIGQKWDD